MRLLSGLSEVAILQCQMSKKSTYSRLIMIGRTIYLLFGFILVCGSSGNQFAPAFVLWSNCCWCSALVCLFVSTGSLSWCCCYVRLLLFGCYQCWMVSLLILLRSPIALISSNLIICLSLPWHMHICNTRCDYYCGILFFAWVLYFQLVEYFAWATWLFTAVDLSLDEIYRWWDD